MKIILHLILLTAILFTGCSDNDTLEAKTNLLVDGQWWNTEIIGSSPTGYTVVSPLFFKKDKSVTIGAGQATWRFIENGNVIEITFTGSQPYTFKIVNLSETEFRFKHYDSSGNFLIELKYGKCDPISVGPC